MGQDSPITKQREQVLPEKNTLAKKVPEAEILLSENVAETRATLLRLLNDYEVLEDSFIMPEDYKVKTDGENDPAKLMKLERAKKNKLRTNWISTVISQLERLSNILDLDPEVFVNLRREFNSLIQRESDLVKERLLAEPADLSDPMKFLSRVKGIKREIAPIIIEDKKRLIEALDFQLKRFLQMLNV